MNETTETAAVAQQTKRPTPAQIAQDIEEIRAELNKLTGQSQAEELADIREKVQHLQLQLAALDARNATADIVLNNAQKVLDRLEEERRKGGKYKWLIENHYFKDRQGKPASHVIYSDATEPRGALDDFRRRSRVQHDQSDKRGDPFKAIKIDPALTGGDVPTSL